MYSRNINPKYFKRLCKNGFKKKKKKKNQNKMLFDYHKSFSFSHMLLVIPITEAMLEMLPTCRLTQQHDMTHEDFKVE